MNIDDLKVGDSVGYCVYPTFGYNINARYPVIYKKVIVKITPKRTKFVLDNGHELNIFEAKRTTITKQL